MICVDHGISSLSDGHCLKAHLLSEHHKIYDELARQEQQYIAAFQKRVGLDCIH